MKKNHRYHDDSLYLFYEYFENEHPSRFTSWKHLNTFPVLDFTIENPRVNNTRDTKIFVSRRRLRLFQIAERKKGTTDKETRNPRIINIISMHRSIITIRSNTRLLEYLPRVSFPIITRKGCHRPRTTPGGVLPTFALPSLLSYPPPNLRQNFLQIRCNNLPPFRLPFLVRSN